METTQVRQVDDGIYLIERPLEAGDPDVAAALVVGQEHAILLDTLTCPADMEPVHDLVGRLQRSLLVVNTHADWDHAWGNCAFPNTPIIGHMLCRQRLLSERATRDLHARQATHPEWFGQVTLRAPSIAFSEAMEIDLGGITITLHHLPGHTVDCLVAHVPQRHLLLAGDCAEQPFPLVGDPAHTAHWARGLRHWAKQGVQTVIPSHGPPAGADFLTTNAAYLESLLTETETDAPPHASTFYREAHRDNVRAVAGVDQR